MDLPTILNQLADADAPPAEAILAARAQQATVAPALIDAIERRVAGQGVAAGLLFYGFHLLGEWRETAAYRPLAGLLALPAEEIDEILGDATNETAHRVMAAVFDGDPQPLFTVIETAAADPFVRARMVETLAMLALDGRLARDAVARYLRDAFDRLQPQDENFVWYGWQSAIRALGLGELSDLVGEACARELIDPSMMSFRDFERDLRYALDHPESPWSLAGPDEYTPFGDTIAELASWHVAGPGELDPDLDDAGCDENWDLDPGELAINPFRNVGRNHPCPCGSGKKFKKCCLV